MMRIEVKVDVARVVKQLTEAQKRQIPFAMARALNDTTRQAVADLRDAMSHVFDRPTPFTTNAFYAKPAKKSDLTAWVGTREFAAKGTAAGKYLRPQVEGGWRNSKRMERRIGGQLLGQPVFVLPGREAALDAFGNWRRGQIGQVLSRLGAFSDTGQDAGKRTTQRQRKNKRTVAASGHRSEYFIAKSQRNGAPLGIWRLAGRGQVVPIAFFPRTTPTYRKRFPFEETVRSSVGDNFDDLFQRALRLALATARR